MLRPDAVVITLGHNNVWDIRVVEHGMGEIGTFEEIFGRIRALPSNLTTLSDDPWYRSYCEQMAKNYRAPYPRPFPCGALVLGFDRRRTEAVGYRLDVATGTCEVQLADRGEPIILQILVDPDADRLWLRTVDRAGNEVGAPFKRVRLMPDAARPDLLWSSGGSERREEAYRLPDVTVLSGPQDGLSFRQRLPAIDARKGNLEEHPRDRAFRLAVRLSTQLKPASSLDGDGKTLSRGALERTVRSSVPFYCCLDLAEGLATEVSDIVEDVPPADREAFADAMERNRRAWVIYWNRSSVRLDDEQLERAWYHNLYFFNCAVKPGVTCPGLFANWSQGAVGTAWHGDYHMNYNTQQAFWATFTSNHVDKHLPYVDLVDHLLPLSQRWARDYYGLRGACFPHSAYPIDMAVPPYPVPTWGWEICETPWTVQSLWWHFTYTWDVSFLRNRAIVPIREAVRFLVDYMQRSEATGDRWGDDRYHIFPTVVPELYGLTPGLTLNADCLADLTLTRFVFRAYCQACEILDIEAEEQSLLDHVHEILAHFPTYPTASSAGGSVYVSVPGEDPEVVYNVPVSTMAVFPGEDIGLHSAPETLQTAVNTYHNQQNEGGNDLVFLNLQAARLGQLDLDRFKRQIDYCLLPNGTCTDMVQQVGGRYYDETPFDFMAPMGIWLENFALPAVVNECLLQSYTGVLRLFPNWPTTRRAEFRSLRAVGAFLVSGACSDGAVDWIEVFSEQGRPLRFINPWSSPIRCTRTDRESILTGDLITLDTDPGETLRFVQSVVDGTV